MKKRITEEMKKEIARLYAEGVKVNEIADRVGIPQSGQVTKIAVTEGCAPRQERKKNRGDKVCPICKHKNPSGSNFCNHCGTDIRSEEDIMMKKVESLRECISFVANHDARSKADEITISLIQYFERRAQK